MNTAKRAILSLVLLRSVVVTTLLVAAVVIQFSTVSFLPLGPFYTLILGAYALSVVYLLQIGRAHV